MTSHEAPDPVPIEALLAHREWVRALARRLLRDRNDADDLEQEVWRMAIQRPPPDARSLRAWLGRVARNAATSSVRRQSTRRARESDVVPRLPAASPAEAVAEAELLAQLASAVVALEEPYRTAAVLHWSHGLEATEIAARLSVPVETVRTRLKRARTQLKAQIEALVDGDRNALCLLLVGLRFDTSHSGSSSSATGVCCPSSRAVRTRPCGAATPPTSVARTPHPA